MGRYKDKREIYRKERERWERKSRSGGYTRRSSKTRRQEKPVRQVAADLGINENMLYQWLKNNALIAVSVKQTDGTSALSYMSGFAAIRHEIEKRADIIFSSAPSDIQFWLGEVKESESDLIKDFGGVKPCLIGGDAYSIKDIFSPEKKKYCWIKAEPTFEVLSKFCTNQKSASLLVSFNQD